MAGRLRESLSDSYWLRPASSIRRTLSPEGDRLLPYTGRGAAALDDAVDEVIEKVIGHGGEVFFYEPGVLDLHQRIAAVLRY